MRSYGRHASCGPGEKHWLKVLGALNEYQARLLVAEKALELGRSGISRLSRLTGMSRVTINKGVAEIQGKQKLRSPDQGRVRGAGGGRKKAEQGDPRLRQHLQRIVEETTAGDPMSLLKWTSKSTRTIAEELRRSGHRISSVTVGRCLEDLGYSLQANVKTREGPQHPNRDAQFRYLNRQVRTFLGAGDPVISVDTKRTFLGAGDPVISVDTKKKELIGAFKNAGRTWRRKGKPQQVSVHDFPHLGKGKAIPYGAYDIARDQAVVNVGITHDTAEFAVESIRRWWRLDGQKNYRQAQGLLICADSGGSNGSRQRAWKTHLQKLCDENRMPITVCHYPPGTSKWNKIEHRLFSFISLNWRGRPLVNYETIVNLIGATTTRSGLRVKAVLDTQVYETGVPISKEEFDQVRIQRHRVHPDWNYTLLPHAGGS